MIGLIAVLLSLSAQAQTPLNPKFLQIITLDPVPTAKEDPVEIHESKINVDGMTFKKFEIGNRVYLVQALAPTGTRSNTSGVPGSVATTPHANCYSYQNPARLRTEAHVSPKLTAFIDGLKADCEGRIYSESIPAGLRVGLGLTNEKTGATKEGYVMPLDLKVGFSSTW